MTEIKTDVEVMVPKSAEIFDGIVTSDLDGIRRAYKAAELFSTDPNTQNGAILVSKSGNVLGAEANHFPNNVAEKDERWERPLKYKYVEHAERGIILYAAKMGIATLGKTMYCPWYACTDCARAIIQAGIGQVVGHQTTIDNTPDRWMGEIELALSMLTEAGVNYRFVKGELGDVEIRFNGEILRP
jgi:dCMP deaminase